ncbi:MAG: hypothetical protein U9P12_04545 [Verrucomicrobiota bacterium]|nr:hypothetical protein [Verrucomicrobiota bacterium]
MKKFGHFDDQKNEYVITDPQTPKPWRNFSWNQSYLMALDQTGQGDGQYHNPSEECRAVLLDARKIYIQDGSDAWNLGYAPICADYDSFRCRVGLHYSVIEQSRAGLDVSCRFFVPQEDPVELWTLTVKNSGTERKTVNLFPGVHFRLDSFPLTVLPHEVLIDANYDESLNAIIARNKSYERPVENYAAFFATDAKVDGFDTLHTAVFNHCMGDRDPAFLQSGCSSIGGGDMGRTIGYFQHTLALEPGEEKTINFVVGHGFDSPVATFTDKFFAAGAIDREFEKKQAATREELGRVALQSTEPHLNRIANSWCKQQTLLGARWARLYSLGVRDILQDAQGVMVLNPAFGKARLTDALRHQNRDGSALRSWDPVVPVKPSDCHMWITLTLTEYIKETGDFQYLETDVPYYDGGSGSVQEHWLRSLEFMATHRGIHGLCLIFDCDWNDSMTIGSQGRGESVWTTEAAVYAMKESLPLMQRIGLEEKAAQVQQWIGELAEACNTEGWDGAWYRRAYTDDGGVVGSASNPELGELFLNAQTWAVLAGIADDEKLASLDAAVEQKLLCEYGYKVSHPGFKAPDPRMRRIASMNPGIYENASVYCHAATFKIVAEYILGRYDKAWAITKSLFTDPEFNPGAVNCGMEPYTFTNQFVGPSGAFPGSSHVGWITGTGSWVNQVLSKYLPGVHPDYDGLKVVPSLPTELGEIKFSRSFRNAVYEFDIALDESLAKGAMTLILNGSSVASDLIPTQRSGTRNIVVVRYNRQDLEQ